MKGESPLPDEERGGVPKIPSAAGFSWPGGTVRRMRRRPVTVSLLQEYVQTPVHPAYLTGSACLNSPLHPRKGDRDKQDFRVSRALVNSRASGSFASHLPKDLITCLKGTGQGAFSPTSEPPLCQKPLAPLPVSGMCFPECDVCAVYWAQSRYQGVYLRSVIGSRIKLPCWY